MKGFRCRQVVSTKLSVVKRSWVILGVAIAPLIAAGAPLAARADVDSDELAWQLLVGISKSIG